MDADAKQSLLHSPIADVDHVSSACSTPCYNTISARTTPGYNTISARTTPCYNNINAVGPQLCHSPPTYHTLSSSSNIQNPDDTEPECQAEGETRVYRRRWYVLILYSVLAGTQGLVWNTWGPISASAEDAFGWTDATIALLSNWGNIAFLVSGIVFSWMMDVKGMRMSCLVTGLLVAAGASLRCITFDTPAVTWLTHVGHFLNGLGGPVAMAAPPILSAVWFPPKERTTATAIGTVLNYMGVASSFVMGPLLVPDVSSTNSTNTTSFLSSSFDVSYSKQNSTAERIHSEKKGITLYMYIQGGWSAAIFLMLLLYFPSKPPLPPCPSAAIPRENFVQGLKHLLTRGQLWLVAFVYGISIGTVAVWSSVLDVILKPHGIGEREAGWIGFYATCGAALGSLVVARFADFFTRIMKLLVITSYIVGTASFVVFALATVKVIPPSTVLFYTTIIVGNTALNAAVPLMFELACELSYPTGEGTTNGVLTIVNNIFGLIFLLVMMIPGIGETWTNWTVVGTSGICIPLLFLMKEKYNRLEIDEHKPALNAEIIFPSPQQ